MNADSSSHPEADHRGLIRRHLLVLTMVVALVLFGYLIVDDFIDRRYGSLGLLSGVGRLQTLTQTVAFQATLLTQAPGDRTRAAALAQAVDQMHGQYLRLQTGDSALSSRVLSQHLDADLDGRIMAFLAGAGEVLGDPGGAGAALAMLQQAATGALREDLEILATALVMESDGQHQRIHGLQIGWMAVWLVFLLITVFLVVRPTLSRLHGQVKQLQEIRRELQAILDALGEGVVMVDSRQRIRRANRKAALLWQCSPEALLEKSLNDLFPDGLGGAGEGQAEDEEGEVDQTRFNVIELRRRDGECRPARLRLNPVRIQGERRLIIAVEDVSRAERAREARRESESLLFLMMESLPLAVIYVDAHQRYRYANRLYASWYRTSPEGIVGQRVEDQVGDETYQVIEPRIRAVLAGQEQRWDTSKEVPGLPLHRENRYFPHLNRQGLVQGYLGLIQDIGQRKAQELALRTALEQAGEAQRFLASFVGNISHEIRTPLNALLGFTELMGETDDPSRRARLIKNIHRATQNLLRLFNDLLEISRLEAGDRAPSREVIDLHILVAEVLEVFRPQAEQRALDLSLALEEIQYQVVLDASVLRQILLNLLGNAVRFTEQGGVVIRGAFREHPGAQQASLCLEVIDTGPGIEPHLQQKIFEMFRQGDETHGRRHGGSGLGLSISQRLVGLLGGVLELESQPGHGSCFRVLIPGVTLRGRARDGNASSPVPGPSLPAAPPMEDLPPELRHGLRESLRELMRRRSFSRIRGFADHLLSLAAAHQLPVLETLGQSLKDAVDSGRVGEINRLLNGLSLGLESAARHDG